LQMAALGSIREAHPDAGLLIVGSGSLDESLRKHSHASAYAGHVFLSGDLDHGAALAAIRKSTVMLRTTWYDGDALSVREALHLGVPVIASDNRMRPKGVHLIPARDRDALVKAVQEVLASSRPCEPVIALDSEHNLGKILGLYDQLNDTT
jgi:glycosyltransferase involved in cell wall biosynthesis